MHYNNKP